jgi:hypothetical protein
MGSFPCHENIISSVLSENDYKENGLEQDRYKMEAGMPSFSCF